MLSSIHDRKKITTRFFSHCFTLGLLCVLGVSASIGQSHVARDAACYAGKFAVYGCFSAFVDMVSCSWRCTLES